MVFHDAVCQVFLNPVSETHFRTDNGNPDLVCLLRSGFSTDWYQRQNLKEMTSTRGFTLCGWNKVNKRSIYVSVLSPFPWRNHRLHWIFLILIDSSNSLDSSPVRKCEAYTRSLSALIAAKPPSLENISCGTGQQEPRAI